MALDFMPYCAPQARQHHLFMSGLEYPRDGGGGGVGEMLNQIRLLLSVQEHVQVQDGGDDPLPCLKEALRASLSPSNCLLVREFSTSNCLPHLTASCDTFIAENFGEMLDGSTSEKDIIGLPRVQVNVDVSRHTNRGSWVPDQTTITGVVLEVVRKLSERYPSHPRRQFVEEKLVNMELAVDMSVEMVATTDSQRLLQKSTTFSDLVKKEQQLPSPSARKLDFKDVQSCNSIIISEPGSGDGSTKRSCSWEIVATHNLVGMGAVSVVRCENNDLLVLNIQLVTKGPSHSLACPISPTTGIPLAVKDSFFAQMDRSRCGFGMVALDDTLMSVGGFNRDGVLRGVESFICGGNSWVRTSSLCTPRARLAVVEHKGKVYAIGGCDGKRDLSSVEVFTSWEESWKESPALRLLTGRSDFGAAVLDGRVYAVGGACYSTILRSVEVLNLSAREDERKWRAVASMATPRRGVAVVSCNGCVYAIGGQASSWGCLKSVECYHPASNEWRKVASMLTPRRNAAAVAIGDRILVIGGYNESSAVNSVEVYDPSTNKWSVGKPMVLKRSGAAAVCVQDAVYIVGGFSGSNFWNSTEKYDIEAEQWTSYFTS